MVVLPIIAAAISLAFTVLVARDALRSPRPDKVSWLIAFAIFAIAAGAEVVGELAGWTPLLARIYYLTGAVLVTLFLGLGQLYLLFGRRIARFAPGVTLAVVAIAVSLVSNAPIDAARLPDEHWRAIDRSGWLIGVVAFSNAFGVVALLGGSLWSAGQFWRTRTRPHRMIGCLLIAAGTLVIASKGYLERLGVPVSDFGFYLLLTAGAAVIFAGYLETRRPERVGDTAPVLVAEPADGVAGQIASLDVAATEPALIEAARPSQPVAATMSTPMPSPEPGMSAFPATGPGTDPGVVFIEARFLPLADDDLDRLATAWSAARIVTERLTQEQARRVWAFRGRLTLRGQIALDQHTLPAALQLADLYDGVFATILASPVPAMAEPLTLVGGQR